MRRMNERAFTLVELLVAIAIVGLMVALLVPAVSGAWETMLQARCQGNLRHIWTAECSWRGDHASVLFTSTSSWGGSLRPYIEGGADIMRDSDASERPDEPVEVVRTNEIVFDFYDIRSGKNSFLFSCPLDGPWARWKDLGGGQYEIGIEDRGFEGGGDKDYADIVILATFEDGLLTRMVKRPYNPKSGSQTQFRYELRIGREVMCTDWHNLLKNGDEIDIAKNRNGLGGLGGSGDYGLSRGTYEIAGTTVPRVDSKLFLVLDYAKAIADYNGDGAEDHWDKYFITDPDAWQAKYGHQGQWSDFQVLRHGGRANVLFCDGHVDALGPEELEETNPRWRYSGR